MRYHRHDTKEGYLIIREKRILWFTIYQQLYYKYINNGVRGKKPYIGYFNKFEYDVKDKCINSCNKYSWVIVSSKVFLYN